MDQTNNSGYIFCCNESQPQSLVMLQKRQRAVQLLLKCPEQISIFWIESDLTQQRESMIERIQNKLRIKITLSKSFNHLLSQRLRQISIQNTIIICSDQFQQKSQKLNGINTFIYCSDEQIIDQNEKNYAIYVNNQVVLIKYLERLIQNYKKVQYRLLPNFIFESGGTKHYTQKVDELRILWGLINWKNDPITRSQIVFIFKN